jgi:hypothetical protein
VWQVSGIQSRGQSLMTPPLHDRRRERAGITVMHVPIIWRGPHSLFLHTALTHLTHITHHNSVATLSIFIFAIHTAVHHLSSSIVMTSHHPADKTSTDYLDLSYTPIVTCTAYNDSSTSDPFDRYPITNCFTPQAFQTIADAKPGLHSTTDSANTWKDCTNTRQPLSSGVPPPDLAKMKLRRKQHAAVWGVTGGVVGLAVLGPLGGVAGGVTSAFIVKHQHKRREKKAMKKYYEHVAEKMAAPIPRDVSFYRSSSTGTLYA